MKRIFAFFLSALLILSLLGCNAEPVSTTEGATETAETEPEKEKKTLPQWQATVERKYETVETPLTPERLAEIPIANASMSIDQLRQICVDYVCLSVTFQWIPNADVKYFVERQGASATFYEGQLYGGIPYVNTASGNMYRWLEFYNTETGIMDMTPFRGSNLLWGTACSGTACWGWQRVINSAKCGWTAGMTVKNGFIRVGNYTYSDTIDRFGEGVKNDCSDIAQANGAQVMYESYALAKKADCLVNNGHVRMIKEDPVIVRNEDGTINPKESYIIQCEQGLYTTSEKHDRYTSDGNKYKIQGNDNYKATFATLYKDGYLPHTFKEFLGTDPVEPGQATIEHTAPTANSSDLQKCTVKANYAISHVITTIRDKDGNQLIRYIKYAENHFTKQLTLLTCLPGNAVQQHQTAGTNTIEMQCQLSNGEMITFYTGTLQG